MAGQTFDWLIAAPAWGTRCVDLFIERALPAIMCAGDGISGKLRFVVHTDEPERIEAALGKLEYWLYPVPPGKTPHESFGLAHREAIDLARHGECIAFINADMVASVEVFAAAERRFAVGKRMIMMAASRTLGGAPPIGAESAELLRWTMQHPHPAIMECFWGSGRSRVPWAVYFERDENIVLHGFHLHPFAAMKDRPLQFQGKTIDVDLADNYEPDEIHLVTDKDEAAFAEISPPERVFPLGAPLNAAGVAEWARSHAIPLHRRFFEQPITITGSSGDHGDREICAKILAAI